MSLYEKQFGSFSKPSRTLRHSDNNNIVATPFYNNYWSTSATLSFNLLQPKSTYSNCG